MKEKEIEFLEDYKKVCIKHRLQILGWDGGAIIAPLEDDEYELECLAYDISGLRGIENIRLVGTKELQNSIVGLDVRRKSTRSIKDDAQDN